MTLIHDINNIIFNMSMSQQLAYLHISGSFFILLSLFSIINIIYDDYLIIKLNLEIRLPKIAKYLKIRRKFKKLLFLFFKCCT